MKKYNIFTSLLKLLNISFTRKYANKLFNEHPHKYSLYGLSQMLSKYNIETKSFKVDDEDKRNALDQLTPPYIIHLQEDFFILEKVSEDKVVLLSNNKRTLVSKDAFLQVWNGVVLIAETCDSSAEPDYAKNRREEVMTSLLKVALAVSALSLMAITFVMNSSYKSIIMLLLVLLNMGGIYISYLLVNRQIVGGSKYLDALCSLFKQGDCNNLLDSEAAKFCGIIHWSEIGLGYFISNLIVVCFYPIAVPYLAVINIFALFYSVWSVWYQKFKAGTWCPLCLITMAIIWATFFTNLIFGGFTKINIFSPEILILTTVFIIPTAIIHLAVPYIIKSNMNESLIQKINALKCNGEVYNTLLKKQAKYHITPDDSQITFGNKNAKNTITIITNPYCSPCAKIHFKLNDLLKKTDAFKLQYIFTSFSEDLEPAVRFLIGSYLKIGSTEAHDIYDNWFSRSKSNLNKFLKDHSDEYQQNTETEREMAKHSKWLKENKIHSTPLVLVNGQQLPNIYDIEDLSYIV